MKARRTLILLFGGGLLFPVSISLLSFCCISGDFVERNSWFIGMVRGLWISVDWLLDDVGSGWTLEIALRFVARSLVNGVYWAFLGICLMCGSRLFNVLLRQVQQRKSH